jgi:hypothetical protein
VKLEGLSPRNHYKNSLNLSHTAIHRQRPIVSTSLHSLAIPESMRLLSLSTLAASISQVLGACSSIEVRKEWREFTSNEQAAWIAAVKVSLLGNLG